MKLFLLFSLVLVLFTLKSYGQKTEIEVENITVYNQYANAIKSLCVELDGQVDNKLKTEIMSYSYHNTLDHFKQFKKFNKLFRKSSETTTIALLSKEYDIQFTYITLLVNSGTYLFSMNHEDNEVKFVYKENNNNTFLYVVDLIENSIHSGCILIIKRFLDNEGIINIKYGLSIGTMQTPLYLEKFARNID